MTQSLYHIKWKRVFPLLLDFVVATLEWTNANKISWSRPATFARAANGFFAIIADLSFESSPSLKSGYF